jgi:hypothetical protein
MTHGAIHSGYNFISVSHNTERSRHSLANPDRSFSPSPPCSPGQHSAPAPQCTHLFHPCHVYLLIGRSGIWINHGIIVISDLGDIILSFLLDLDRRVGEGLIVVASHGIS